MDSMMLEGPQLVEGHPGDEGEQTKVKRSILKQKWETLQTEAEQRFATFIYAALSFANACCMIQILPSLTF